jgi:hypothetical protein
MSTGLRIGIARKRNSRSRRINMPQESIEKAAKVVVSFLDEEDEISAFVVGVYSAFKKMAPGQKAKGLPLSMIQDAEKQYRQYYAGFYAMRVAQAVGAIVVGYFTVV